MIKILNHHPQKYLTQGLIHCGAFSVKAILSAYGKDDKKDPREYYPSIFGKYLALAGSSTWPNVLKSYDLDVGIGNVKNLSYEQKIEILKKSIDEDRVLMIRIGNGYLKNGTYSPLISYFVGHWITIWGYDDEKEIFYLYDSYIPTERTDKTLLIGNTTRTFSEVTRDWARGFPPSWRYRFITIEQSPLTRGGKEGL